MKFFCTNSIITSLVTTLLTGCVSLTPLTQEIKTNIERDGVALSKIQFYTEKRIVLNINQIQSNRSINSGSVKQKSRVTKNYVEFRPKLTGVYQKENQNLLYICFDKSKPSLSLPFYIDHKNEFILGSKPNAIVIYDTKQQNIEKGVDCRLMIDAKIRSKYKTKTTKAKGFRISQLN